MDQQAIYFDFLYSIFLFSYRSIKFCSIFETLTIQLLLFLLQKHVIVKDIIIYFPFLSNK